MAWTPRNSTKALAAANQPEAAGKHDDQAREQGADGGNEGEQPGLNPEDEGAGHADQHQADPGDAADGQHGDHLGNQPALQRAADIIHNDGHRRAILLRRERQQAPAIGARLGGEGESEKQHDEEISERADRAENDLKRLADDGAAAGGKGAGTGKVVSLGFPGKAGAGFTGVSGFTDPSASLARPPKSR